jgi:hypothetical protein
LDRLSNVQRHDQYLFCYQVQHPHTYSYSPDCPMHLHTSRRAHRHNECQQLSKFTAGVSTVRPSWPLVRPRPSCRISSSLMSTKIRSSNQHLPQHNHVACMSWMTYALLRAQPCQSLHLFANKEPRRATTGGAMQRKMQWVGGGLEGGFEHGLGAIIPRCIG